MPLGMGVAGELDFSRMSLEFLAGLIDHIAHPLFVKDRDFRFVLVNLALCEMIGRERHEVLGKTDFDFFPPEQAEFFRLKDLEMFATGARVNIEEEPITDATGSEHVLRTTKVPFRGEAGEVTHLVGIISDITEVKKLEGLLRRANEDLERRVEERTQELVRAQDALVRSERLAALGELAGGLAHQLRNPLGVIQNAVGLLRRANLVGLGREALDIIAEEVGRADHIIHGLLDFVRVIAPSRRNVSLLAMVHEVIGQETFTPGIDVRIDVPEAIEACVDPIQVQTAMSNVIRNAIEAMPSGGTLTVHGSASHGGVELWIEDTGVGVSSVAEVQLFRPLRTTKPVGVGLGLSTARNLIEAQGGCVDYVPGSERGARFRIKLPMARSACA